ncbi:MAG TPA: hypothetical protein VGB50_11765 [Flavobacterium sp.]|jgi:hypothetical protein
MDALLSRIIKINELRVVGMFRAEESEEYFVLTIKKRKNKIHIVSTFWFETFADLLKGTSTNLPVLLVIDGKGILNKEVDFGNDSDVNWYRSIDFSAIHYTSVKTSKKTFISFCRKSIAEDVISAFKAKKFQIAGVYIGPLLASLPKLSIGTDKIITGNSLLEYETGELVKVSRHTGLLKPEYKISENDALPGNYLPLYGALIHFFMHSTEVSKTGTETQAGEIIYKKACTVFGISMLVIFLFSLLASYCVTSYYGSLNAALNLEKVYSGHQLQVIQDLDRQKEERQRILNESGFLADRFLSFYAYEIIKSIPADIGLKELAIAPPEGEVRTNKKMLFSTGIIIVKGETFSESSFNNWISGLKNIGWIKDFEIKSVKKDKKNKSIFEVQIRIANV